MGSLGCASRRARDGASARRVTRAPSEAQPHRRAATLALAAATLLAASPAAADSTHGRLEADLSLEIGLGGGVAFEGMSVLGAGTLELRARYLDMAGLVLGGELRPDGASRAFLGVDLRPLFLARFFLGGGTGTRYLDVLIDSVGIDLGVAVLPLDERVGVAFAVGFGVDVPLVFFSGGYDGISLRLAGRHVAALPTDRLGPTGGVNDWIAMAAIVVRGAFSTGLPAWEPRRYELPDPERHVD